MNQSNATFTGLDPNQAYEATVGTETLSTGMRGPISERIGIPAISDEGSSNTIVIAISVVFIATVLIVTIAVVIIVLSRSRRSTLEFTKDFRCVRYTCNEELCS